jgi:hypothetical protein
MTFTESSSSHRLVARLATISTTTALLLMLASPTGARAADSSSDQHVPKTYTAMVKMKPTDVMHLMDKDGTGYVTREEFMKFYEQLFQQLDSDRDARITEPEFTDAG